MAKTILITSLGTGMYKEGYQKTTYRFLDKTDFAETHFLHAVLKHDPSINRVVLLGTRTSSWDVFAEHRLEEWERIKNECESEEGLRPETEQQVADCLAQAFPDVEFLLKVHTPHLDRDTVESVLATYNTIPETIPEGSDVIFDITHGFRSMPLLIYQALQLDAEKIASCNVSLIYGEYNPTKRISFVRDLSAYWELSETAKDKTAFFSRFDGKRLAGRLKPYWEAGSKAVQRWTDCVACNFAIQLPESLRQIYNALDRFTPAADTPRWVFDVRDFLATLHARLSRPEDYETVLEFARLLDEKKLTTQAVIALQISIELAITSHYGTEEDCGNYEWWQSEGRGYYTGLKKGLPESKRRHLSKIEETRNQLAHGGGKSAFGGGGFPQAANMPEVLKNGFAAVEALFAELKH